MLRIGDGETSVHGDRRSDEGMGGGGGENERGTKDTTVKGSDEAEAGHGAVKDGQITGNDAEMEGESCFGSCALASTLIAKSWGRQRQCRRRKRPQSYTRERRW